MKELILQIVTYLAPIVAGFITSILIPHLIKKVTLNKLEKKIEEVNEGKALRDIKMELAEIKKEIFIMRGKVK